MADGTATGACTAGAVVTAPASVSIIAITAPTFTISPSLNNVFTNVPATGEGTSESTLSVAISNTDSSASIASPAAFTHLMMVASATLSPIFGSSNSY